MTGPVTLALEGPPGAGKTTLLGALVPGLGDTALFFSEPNIKLSRGTGAPVHSSPAAHTLWYLRQEQARAAALRAVPADVVVCDRNHLGVLAYTFAARRQAAFPYGKAVAYYRRNIAPLYDTRLRTVILLVSVAASLTRRGGKPAHPRWRQWYDPRLLERMRQFYTEHAPDLCPNPPLIIDTDPLTPAAVLSAVADELRAAGASLPASLPAAPHAPTVDARFADFYRQFGGAAVLGGTVTDAFPHRGGGVMQMFQLASLIHTRDGITRLWNPFDLLPTHDPCGAIPCPVPPHA
ncbi:AAA family ATPase [Acrocarpospora catenulata]|uniref:AAA family ATPase n=1 Tax=Acrocarpospora catenulata TaxID=2836182 RepID=UPI001BDA1535|nr:AAA family ATPase [Acrocarpospora catenulata]